MVGFDEFRPMTRDSPCADGSEDGPLAAARRALQTERQRTVDERDALAAFRTRVRAVDAVGASPAREAGPGVRTAASPGLTAVRDAYEATVMSVPHYREEYDDPYEASLEAEFGPDVAAALARGTRFDERCKRSVLAKAAEAREQRERFLATLDAERESLTDAEERIHAVLDRVEAAALADDDPTFGALDAVRSTLVDLRSECDSLAADRQAAIRRQRRRLWLPRDAPDVPAYLYRDLPATYPVLSVVADLGERVAERRRDVERAMARAE